MLPPSAGLSFLCLKFDSSKKAKRIDRLVEEEKEYGIFQREEWKDAESQVQMKS